jgi:hypothetical protein
MLDTTFVRASAEAWLVIRLRSHDLRIFYTVECVKCSLHRFSGAVLSIAALAQLVEQLLRKEKVNSSIPLSGTTSPKLVIWNPQMAFFLAFLDINQPRISGENRATLASHKVSTFCVAAQCTI